MVDLSIVFCKRLPEGTQVFSRFLQEPQQCVNHRRFLFLGLLSRKMLCGVATHVTSLVMATVLQILPRSMFRIPIDSHVASKVVSRFFQDWLGHVGTINIYQPWFNVPSSGPPELTSSRRQLFLNKLLSIQHLLSHDVLLRDEVLSDSGIHKAEWHWKNGNKLHRLIQTLCPPKIVSIPNRFHGGHVCAALMA